MSLITVDQGVSGASNILVVLFIAHVLSPADFGRFTLLFFAYSLAAVVGRSMICATVLVHPEDADDRPRAVLGSSILFAVGVGAAFVVAGAILHALGAALGLSVGWLGLLVPLMLVQDVGRFLGIAVARPIRALWLDLVWLLLEVAAFATVVARDLSTLELCVVVWAGAGAASGLLVFVQYGVPRAGELNLEWLRSRWDFLWRSMVTAVASQASALIGFSAVAVVSSGAAVGAVRAATLLTRPGFTVLTGVAQSAVADMSREHPDHSGTARHVRRTLVVSMAAAGVNLVALLLIPDTVGRAILGRTWAVAEPLLLAAGLHLLLVAARNGLRAVLLSRREIRLIMFADVTAAVMIVGLSFVGALVADAQGVMWAVAAGTGVESAAWWVLYRRRMRATQEAPLPA